MKNRLLLVEDDPDLLQIMKIWASFNEYDCDSDETGAECINKALSYRPNLILLDLNLPHVNGLSLISQLKNNEKLRNIPIVVLSACTDDKTINEAIRLGAKSFISKNKNPADIFDKIRAWG